MLDSFKAWAFYWRVLAKGANASFGLNGNILSEFNNTANSLRFARNNLRKKHILDQKKKKPRLFSWYELLSTKGLYLSTISHTRQLPFSPWNYGLRYLVHTSMLTSTPSFSRQTPTNQSLGDIACRCVMTCVQHLGWFVCMSLSIHHFTIFRELPSTIEFLGVVGNLWLINFTF